MPTKYTKEQKEFLESYIPGHHFDEIVAEYNRRFDEPITNSRAKAYAKNHKIKTGFDGRFVKGQKPIFKYPKGKCAKGSEKTWFKKGQAPVNHREVESERITRDGYVEVKVQEPNVWKLKHRLEWEKVNGEVPEGYCIIFKDNDRTNCDIDNLMIIKRSTNLVLNRSGMSEYKGDLKETAVLISNVIEKTRERR